MTTAAVDNDILFKGACYGLLNELANAIPSTPKGIGVLGAAKYVVPAKLRRAKLNRSTQQVSKCLEELFQAAVVLEPTVEEQRYAAELEASAQQADLQLDTGESQLCAIVVARAIPWLVTGDKRAIAALERLLGGRDECGLLAQKVVCLEQLFLRLIDAGDGSIRRAVCAEASIDKALTACFSCYSEEANRGNWREGLISYIRDLRNSAPSLLAQ